jgi:N-acetylmuramic acid 6-phosphate (MurNAc-6-P) etherase
VKTALVMQRFSVDAEAARRRLAESGGSISSL